MCAFLACLFYAIFCLNVLSAVIALLVRLRLIQLGVDLEFIFGKKLAELMDKSTNSTAITMAVTYLLYIIFWHFA